MFRSNKKGIVLVAAIMALAFAAIVITGVTVYVVQHLELNEVNQANTRSLYNAQAGIHRALYDIRTLGFINWVTVNIDASNKFTVKGLEADPVVLNASGANFTPNGKNLRGLIHRNGTGSQSVTIDKMKIWWDESLFPGVQLRRIRLQQCTNWSGFLSPPAIADLPNDCVLNPAPSQKNINRITFTDDISAIPLITIEYEMTDGTFSKVLTAYPPHDDQFFTVKSTGETSGSNMFRTIKAVYNADTESVVEYNEISTKFTP